MLCLTCVWCELLEKRDNRRKEINRPRRSVVFKLDENKTKEFRVTDIVQPDETKKIQSALRNKASTPGRLVKLRQTAQIDDMDSDTNTNATAATASQSAQSAGAAPANRPVQPAEENFETQSGDGSNQDERESGEA